MSVAITKEDNDKAQMSKIHREVEDIHHMLRCAVNALDNPACEESGKKTLIIIAAKLSGLDEELELMVNPPE